MADVYRAVVASRPTLAARRRGGEAAGDRDLVRLGVARTWADAGTEARRTVAREDVRVRWAGEDAVFFHRIDSETASVGMEVNEASRRCEGFLIAREILPVVCEADRAYDRGWREPRDS